MTCPIHRRYQAKRKPRVLCEDCWRMWFEAEHQREWEASDACKRMKARDAFYAANPDARAFDDWINSPG